MLRITRVDCWYLNHIEFHVMNQLLKTPRAFLPWTQCLVFVGPKMERSNHMKQSQSCSKGGLIQHPSVRSGQQRVVIWKEPEFFSQPHLSVKPTLSLGQSS